ncbi:unnamed protein product [Meloidogyne enterolobii]|uniref:Uncharacterized protein n=1 Tax=Meloidogyne enterolobii TaxID=390850 RepID=A0ACB0XKB1_MELEN
MGGWFVVVVLIIVGGSALLAVGINFGCFVFVFAGVFTFFLYLERVEVEEFE